MGSVKGVLRAFIPEQILARRRKAMWKRLAADAGLNLCASDHYIDLEKAGLVIRLRLKHAIYLQHIVENFDFYGGSVEPMWEEGKRLVDMSGPRYHRLIGFDSIPFLFPSHTEPYVATEEYLDFARLQPGEVVLDIGAYSGVTSISFAQRVGAGGHVYAFEADEVNYRCASENIRMAQRWMGIDNIALVNQAVWEHNDGIRFSNELAMGSAAVEISGGGRGQETLVPSTTLESFCEAKGLTRLDFVKMDIEGAELKVLQQSAAFLARMKARLAVEPHAVDGEMCTAACCRLLEQVGYSVALREQAGVFPPLIVAEMI